MRATAGEQQVRRDFYGIAEIADALGLARQLVTVWRKRRSHGIPEPDAELASGPIWLGSTVEPWIDQVRDRSEDDTPPQATPALALRATRRMLRLAVLLLEDRPRTGALDRALYEARELVSQVAACRADEVGTALRDLLAPVAADSVDPGSPSTIAALRAGVPSVLVAATAVTGLVPREVEGPAGQP
jgi:transposase-like protein